MRVQFDHIALNSRYPDTERDMEQVPRCGEDLQLFGKPWSVHRVVWFLDADPPCARIVLRTPEEVRREIRLHEGDRAP